MSESTHNQILTPAEEAHLRARIEHASKATKPRARLSLHCWRSGNLQEAIEWVDSCLILDPLNVGFYRIRANVLADMSQSAKAVETALKAVEVAPQSVMARLLTARMLMADLQLTRAQKVLDEALELGPDHDQLRHMKSLQIQLLNMTAQSEHKPLEWLSRKIRKRLADVANEDQDPT